MTSRLLAFLFLAASAVAATSQVLSGQPAMQGGTVQTAGYLSAKAVSGNPLEQRIEIWMTSPQSAAPIRQFQVEMTKKMHVIIVSDDFKTFLHVHPTLNASGHFVVTQKFPAPGSYLIYADALPNNLAHQVFRFAVQIGEPSRSVARKLPDTGKRVQAGPYEVELSTATLRAGRMEMIDVSILQNGHPANDLHPYLGAPAHAVFLNAKDLSYVHVHPMAGATMMDMSKPMPDLPDSARVGADMMLHIALREAGTYRLWLQFRGADDRLYVAEFTIHAA